MSDLKIKLKKKKLIKLFPQTCILKEELISTFIHFPNRDELSLRKVFALPNDSSKGFDCNIFSSIPKIIKHSFEKLLFVIQ